MYSKHCHFVAEGTTTPALFDSRKLHHLPPLDALIDYTPYGGTTTSYEVKGIKLIIEGVRYPPQPGGSNLDVEEHCWMIELAEV
jgi:hypothetical protein